MTLIKIIAYVLLQCIFPVVAEYGAYGQNRSIAFALWLAVAMTASMCFYGYLIREEPLRKTWRKIWHAEGNGVKWKRRGLYALLNLFTVFSCFSAVFAFQGGVGDSGEEAVGSGTVANVVDTVGALFIGLIITFVFESGWLVARSKVIQLLLVGVACGFTVLFIVFKDVGIPLNWALLNKPVVYLSLSWALFGTLNMQIIRSEFIKGAGISRGEFLFFRFIGPATVAVAVIVGWQVSRDQPQSWTFSDVRDTLLAIAAIAVAYVYVVSLQFTLLKERSVAALNAADLAIPGITYILALVLGLTGERTNPLSFFFAGMVIVALYIAETLPEKWLGWKTTFRAMTREVWGGVAADPTMRISGWLLSANVRGLLLTVAIFGPVIVDLFIWLAGRIDPANAGGQVPERELLHLLRNGSWFWFLVIFVIMFQLFSMTLLAGRVHGIMKDELVSRFYWDAVGRAHLFKRLFTDVLVVTSRLLKPGVLPDDLAREVRQTRAEATFGLRKCVESVDTADALLNDAAPNLDINPDPTTARSLLDRQFELLTKVIRLNGAVIEYDFSSISDDIGWVIDQDRLFLVWHNLVLNALDAWRREKRAADLSGLKIRITGWLAEPKDKLREKGRRIAVEVRDNGPGLKGQEADDALEEWLSSTTPGGQGLGLRISRLYAEGHGGKLLIGSEVAEAECDRAPASDPNGSLTIGPEVAGMDSDPAGFLVQVRLPLVDNPALNLTEKNSEVSS